MKDQYKRTTDNYFLTNDTFMIVLSNKEEVEVTFLLLNYNLIFNLFNNLNSNDTILLNKHSPIFLWGEIENDIIKWKYQILGQKRDTGLLENWRNLKVPALGSSILVVLCAILYYIFG